MYAHSTTTDSKADEDQKKDDIKVLDAGDIQVLKTYGRGPYADQLKKIENEIEEVRKRVNERMGVKESETGLAPPNLVRRQRCLRRQIPICNESNSRS